MSPFQIYALPTALVSVCVYLSIRSAVRYHKKEIIIRRGMQALQTTVSFLQDLNALPAEISADALQSQIVKRLQDVLKPFKIFPRLWIANTSWNTLQGIGE